MLEFQLHSESKSSWRQHAQLIHQDDSKNKSTKSQIHKKKGKKMLNEITYQEPERLEMSQKNPFPFFKYIFIYICHF